VDRIARILSEPQKQTILVVGLARSGISAALALHRLGAEVIGTDRKQDWEGLDQLQDAGVRVELGGDRTELVKRSSLVVLSPGVQLRPLAAPVPAEATRLGVPVVGELELAHRLLGSGSRAPTLAVTGTNGKSTTTALCAHLLTQAGHKVFLGGNIGRPLSELVLSGEEVDWAVVEVSSFQLEHLTRPEAFVPKVGIWLNLTPDHLDRHVTVRNYGRMKRRMFEGMGSSETGVFWLDDSNVHQQHEGLACTVSGVSRNPARVPLVGALLIREEITPNGWDHPFVLDNERLKGDHNAENAACAVSAALAIGLEEEAIQSGLNSFTGLPHRLEPVRELQDVRYVNDSKGTNPDATAKSLTSYQEPVILIAGGRGKGTGYGQLREIVSKRVRHLILMGEEADNLARELEGCAEVHRVDNMAEAVLQARRLAEPGSVVLLSPACASFDMFQDYAERGDIFKEHVKALEEDG
jgi:UDP-N-acetylmuramoylalanine--D-glutamate ligase